MNSPSLESQFFLICYSMKKDRPVLALDSCTIISYIIYLYHVNSEVVAHFFYVKSNLLISLTHLHFFCDYALICILIFLYNTIIIDFNIIKVVLLGNLAHSVR